ncbi:hypothetical protein RRG08_005938 [Elysia crispata]|uniref:Uncharacterized protein n=1 Tax=Elysia crispata TaxID=231223 RepID=A0AAE1A4U3_9GAST|nr:hypothetical protein RRG08_005938 [Elysia crispata]
MAAGMTPGSLAAKEKVIDHMEDMFHEKLKSFTSDVKTKMRSVSREAAVLVFELALLFFTQALPDLDGFESASDVVQVQEKASSFQHKVENDLDKLNEANESNKHQILGLRKLQKLLSDKTKISQTTAVTTPSTTKASASAAATPCRPPKSLSQRSTFSARAPSDSLVPSIVDTMLLPEALVVLSDYNNKCVKLYDWQGRHIHTQALDSNPRCADVTVSPSILVLSSTYLGLRSFLLLPSPAIYCVCLFMLEPRS